MSNSLESTNQSQYACQGSLTCCQPSAQQIHVFASRFGAKFDRGLHCVTEGTKLDLIDLNPAPSHIQPRLSQRVEVMTIRMDPFFSGDQNQLLGTILGTNLLCLLMPAQAVHHQELAVVIS